MHDPSRDQRKQTMTFTYQFEPADWIAFSLHYLRNSRTHHRQRLRARFWFLAAFLALSLILFFETEKDRGLVINFSVVGVVGFFAYPKVYDDAVMKRMRKYGDDPDNAKWWGRQTVTFSAEGIRICRSTAESRLAWSNVVRLAETPDHLFVYISAAEAIVVPRRSLEGASFEDVRRQLQQYVTSTTSATG
jgi:hypothetical protein